MRVPLKEAIDVLADKFEFKALFQFFEEMGLDTNALAAEKQRRTCERKAKLSPALPRVAALPQAESRRSSVLSKNPHAASRETDSLIKADAAAELSEDLQVEKMKEADRAQEARSRLEASELAEKGLRLGRLIRQESMVMSQEMADTQEGLQKVLKQNCRALKRVNMPLAGLNRGSTLSSDDSEIQSSLPPGSMPPAPLRAVPAKPSAVAAEVVREFNAKFALQLHAQQ